MASNNKKNNKKAVVDYSKKEKKVKQYLLLDSNTHKIYQNGLIDGIYVLEDEVRKYGKLYYKVRNNIIESL